MSDIKLQFGVNKHLQLFEFIWYNKEFRHIIYLLRRPNLCIMSLMVRRKKLWTNIFLFTLRRRYPAIFLRRIPSLTQYMAVGYRRLSLRPGLIPSQPWYLAIFLGIGIQTDLGSIL